jgi:hypothetical protein
MSPVPALRTRAPQSSLPSAATKSPRPSGLRIGPPSDAFEREADRVADSLMSQGNALAWSFGSVRLGQLQRQPAPGPPPSQDAPSSQPAAAPQPNNYKEGAAKLGEAFLQTDIGKKLKDAATQDPLVKGAEDFIGTLPGKIIAGTAAAGAVTALAATHKALPAQIPEIPLDAVRPGLKVKIDYEGPVDRPTKAMITFSYTPQGDKKKPAQTDSEKYRAETARIAADQEKFRAGMKYAPGTPEAKQQEADRKMMDDYLASKLGALPGTGGRPLVPAAGASGQTSGSQWSFSPLAQPDQDKKLDLEPAPSSAPSGTLQRKCACQQNGPGSECEECKKKPETMQRKAAGPAELDTAPPVVGQVLQSSGRPLEQAARAFFEPRFGYDFSRVRVHTDAQAAESARAVNALAYTVGDRIAFAAGRYSPNTTEGRRLLAHELAHTVQQSGGRHSSVPQSDLKVGRPRDNFERQADSAAERVAANHTAHALRGQPSRLGQVPVATVQRQDGPYDKLSIPKLRKLARTDPEAAEALRLRFRAMSNVDLERYARNDPMAQAVYKQRNLTPEDAEGHGPFSDRSVRDALENDIKQQRGTGIPRRAPSAVEPNVEVEGGTVGSARTDIPGLENRAFVGRSPQAGGKVNPASEFAPATDPKLLPQTHGHAEQDIADQLAEALRKIPREQLKGRRVWMLIEQEPCSTCAQGASNPKVAPGVLKKLSQEFPEVIFEIKDLNSNAIIVLKGGSGPGGATPPAGETGAKAPSGKKGGGTGGQGGQGREGGESGPSGGKGGATPNFSLAPLAESTEVKPASPSEVIARQRVIGQLETETAESVRFSTRLQVYGAVFGGLMQVYSAINTVEDALQFAADGTKFPAEQAKVEQLANRSQTDLDAANAVTANISLLQAVAAVSDARERADGDALFELSDALSGFGMPIRNAADKAVDMADELDRRAKAINVLEDYFAKMVDLPMDPMAGTIPQAQAFTVYESLSKFLGPLNTAARNYHSAATVLDYYANYTLGLAHEANKSAWALVLRRLTQSAQAAQKNAPPRRQPASHPPTQQQSAPPPALLAPPGMQETPKTFEPLPGAPGPSPIREAETVVGNFKTKALELIARGEKLKSSSPGQDEIKAFAKDEAEWRNAATIVMKHYADHGPDVGRSGMDEVLNSDQYGGRLKQIRQSFGE